MSNWCTSKCEVQILSSSFKQLGKFLRDTVDFRICLYSYMVEFYGISTLVGYLMPNPFYTYISNIYDLVSWLCFMAYQPLYVI